MTIACSVWSKTEAELSRCGWCSSHVYCSKFLKFNSRCDDDCEVSFHTGTKCQKKDWPTYKAGCRRQSYLHQVDLHLEFTENPRITRTLSCPATATFAAFHEALLVAFGWANTYLYDFDFLAGVM